MKDVSDINAKTENRRVKAARWNGNFSPNAVCVARHQEIIDNVQRKWHFQIHPLKCLISIGWLRDDGKYVLPLKYWCHYIASFIVVVSFDSLLLHLCDRLEMTEPFKREEKRTITTTTEDWLWESKGNKYTNMIRRHKFGSVNTITYIYCVWQTSQLTPASDLIFSKPPSTFNLIRRNALKTNI